MTGAAIEPPALGSLHRKAAVDAGFDLEPERDGAWWRLRSSGAPGVAWVHRPAPGDATLLALPLLTQLEEVGLTPVTNPVLELPIGAAGAGVCASPHELHSSLRRLWGIRVSAPERMRAQWEKRVSTELAAATAAGTPPTTEAVAEVRRRVGQNVFREALLDYWEGRCAVTGLAVPELLRASHIKPWAVASDAERLDVHNGLLLAVHLDALFDQGYISFDEDGCGMLSPSLPPGVLETFGLSNETLLVDRLAADHGAYLSYHRRSVFRSG